jgi:hypothetical protein
MNSIEWLLPGNRWNRGEVARLITETKKLHRQVFIGRSGRKSKRANTERANCDGTLEIPAEIVSIGQKWRR